METLLIIICLLWGILNFILFFKIWGACNDIKLIAKKIDSQYNSDNNADKVDEIDESIPQKELTEEEIKSNKAADLRMRYGRF